MQRGRIVLIVAVCLGDGMMAVGAPPGGCEPKSAAKAAVAEKDRSGDPAVDAWYDHLLAAYRKADWEEFRDLHRDWLKMRLRLAPAQRDEVLYMRKTAEEFRPAWWKHTRSTKNTSFQARIWGRWFTANFVPSDSFGEQRAVGVRNGKLLVVVSWRPSYVDNPKPFSNDNSFFVFVPDAKEYGYTLGTLAEVIVWHELGHNYISLNLPLKHVLTLYNEYSLLFLHLQEFYADLTALYHASLPGRLFAMRFRLMNLVDYDENNVHTRGCAHAIGALLLAKALSEPEQWPSFHFPGKIPRREVERMAIFYLLRHVDPRWTLAEDRRLREFIGQWVRSQGEAALRRKGRITLPGGQMMRLLASEDREFQQKRDRWVRRKLEAILAAGRADKPEIFQKDLEDIENRVRFVPVRRLREEQDQSEPQKQSRTARTERSSAGETPAKQKTPPEHDDLDDVLNEPDE